MADRPRGGLAALCIAQTTSWGLLYYSLPVAVPPISEDTDWSHTTITAAFSLGLIVSAVAGLRVGTILDHQGPRQAMTFGALAGVLALALVAWSPNPLMFFLAWLVAGFSQSAVLYPPAFVVITRWYGSRRVGPLTTLTLIAGLASTIFAPLVAYLIEQFGWRISYLIMAGILAAVTVPMHACFLNSTWSDTPTPDAATTFRIFMTKLRIPAAGNALMLNRQCAGQCLSPTRRLTSMYGSARTNGGRSRRGRSVGSCSKVETSTPQSWPSWLWKTLSHTLLPESSGYANNAAKPSLPYSSVKTDVSLADRQATQVANPVFF